MRNIRNILELRRLSLSGAVAACSLSGIAGAAMAAPIPYIGVQFQVTANGGSTALTADQAAGVVPQSNFNVVNVGSGVGSGTTGTLNDASGSSTGTVTLDYSSGDGWTSGTSTATPDGIFLSGEDKAAKNGGTAASYTLNNLPAGTYDLLVYTVNDTTGNADVTQGSTTFYVADQTGNQWNSNGYVKATSTTVGTYALASYAEFDNISVAAGGSVNFTDFAAATASVNGFQLLSVPEPASLGLLGLGAVGLLARRRRPS